MDTPDPATLAANGFLQLSEQLAPVMDFVDGQREELTRRGYSPTAAEAMAMSLYGHCIHLIFGQAHVVASGQ